MKLYQNYTCPTPDWLSRMSGSPPLDPSRAVAAPGSPPLDPSRAVVAPVAGPIHPKTNPSARIECCLAILRGGEK